MTFDAHKNFAYSTVAVAPVPDTSGLALTVATGDGALFPAVPFNATVWPAGVAPLASNAEIVRVTGIATDVFTIVRAQESSSAKAIAAGYQIADTITVKVITDIENAMVQGPASAVSAGDFAIYDGTTGKLIKDTGLSPTTDGTLAGNSDSLIPTEKAVKTYARPASSSLSDIASANPTGADWDNNAKKITGIKKATASTDVASLANSLDQFTAPAADVGMNSHKLTGLAAGAAAGDSLRMEQLLYSGFQAPTGAIAERFPRALCSSASLGAATSGVLRMYLIWLPVCTVTSISFMIGGTAMTGGTHGWHALFDSSRNLLRQSTDDTSAAASANTIKTYNLSSTYNVTAAGLYYIGYCYVATQMPTNEGFALATNLGVAGLAPIMAGNSTTALTGTAPNPAAAIGALGVQCYGYVS